MCDVILLMNTPDLSENTLHFTPCCRVSWKHTQALVLLVQTCSFRAPWCFSLSERVCVCVLWQFEHWRRWRGPHSCRVATPPQTAACTQTLKAAPCQPSMAVPTRARSPNPRSRPRGRSSARRPAKSSTSSSTAHQSETPTSSFVSLQASWMLAHTHGARRGGLVAHVSLPLLRPAQQ